MVNNWLVTSNKLMIITMDNHDGDLIGAAKNGLDKDRQDDDDVDIDDESDIGKNRFTYVRVLHQFRGSNNDELCMKKDDIITLTQTPSGGWWEGTLDGITGWFPSNYVTPIQPNDPVFQQLCQQSLIRPGSSADGRNSYDGNGSGSYQQWNNNSSGPDSLGHENLEEYRSMVMNVIEDSETQFIQSLQDAISYYLMPIFQYKVLSTETELNAVLRSITEICSVHRRFLNSIEKIKTVPYKDNRIGGLFMQYAPQFKHAHFEYCSYHAKFVQVIEKYKKEICQFFAGHSVVHGPPPPSLASPSHHPGQTNLAQMPNVQITALLSVSFRRLDKYPALLQELQRYTEENHPDRGDIQRAGFLYREISMSCLELRRRKEMELEVMLGNIKNFDNLNIESYGQIIKMEPVSILIVPSWSEPKKDCYLVLFPKVLMILSVGKEMTCFTFESMMKLENAKLSPINLPVEHAVDSITSYPMEVTGINAHPNQSIPEQFTYVVAFPVKDVWREFYQALQKQIRHSAPPAPPPENLISISSASNSGAAAAGSVSSSSSSSSSSAIVSPQSLITSPDQPVPATLPPKPPQFRIQHMMGPLAAEPSPVLPSHHHPRPPPPKPPGSGPMTVDQVLQSIPKRSSFWSDQFLTPHIPYRPTSAESSSLNPSDSVDHHSEPNDELQLLNVIDAYHRKFPQSHRGSGLLPGNDALKSRKLSSTNNPELDNSQDLEPYQYVEIVGVIGRHHHHHHQQQFQRNPSARKARKNSLTMLANKINKLSLSSMDRDVLYEIYDQLRVIRNEMSHLAEKVRDERRQRKRLQNFVGRMHQSPQHHRQQL